MGGNNSGAWPVHSDEEIDAVSEVLRSGKVNYWTGQEGRLFEKEFAEFAETDHAVAVANGTVALDLALHGLGIGAHNGGSKDDEVIVTPRSFIASASAIVNAGAIPVFADVDRDSQNITAKTCASHITANTVAIICVHLAGWPCDMDGFADLVKGSKIKLIEDCAQAHGAVYKGKPVGGLGDVAAWSFCQDKIMSTGGEGGMVTCNDSNLWKRMWAFKDHGKSWDAVYEREHPKGFRWLHESIGTNWRLTEMQSAIGRLQLKKLPKWQAARAGNVAKIERLLAPFAAAGYLRLPQLSCAGCNGNCELSGGCRHAFYKFYGFIRPGNLANAVTRDSLIDHFCKNGLACMQGSCSEIYREKAFSQGSDGAKIRLSVARELGENSIMFAVHPGINLPNSPLPTIR